MNQIIRLGISTCPNDTFAFHGLLSDKVDRRGLRWEIQLRDIQQLNDGLAAGEFDVAKASYFAALQMSDRLVVLRPGSAIGFGVGPLLLSSRDVELGALAIEIRGQTAGILCPGETTTASFLCQTVLPFSVKLTQTVFSNIIPQLQSGQALLGACIHEGRFVWREAGLHCIADLGALWESRTGRPLPLGGLFASRRLAPETLHTAQTVIRESIEYGLSHREETLPTMRRHALEMRDEVLFAHVDLYVNQWTIDLGDVGCSAIECMHRLAVARGVIDPKLPPLRILEAVPINTETAGCSNPSERLA